MGLKEATDWVKENPIKSGAAALLVAFAGWKAVKAYNQAKADREAREKRQADNEAKFNALMGDVTGAIAGFKALVQKAAAEEAAPAVEAPAIVETPKPVVHRRPNNRQQTSKSTKGKHGRR